MTTTGQNLLQGFSEFIGDFESSTSTSNGNSGGTTLVDTYMTRYGDNRLVGMFIRITVSGGNQYFVRRIISNVQSSGTITVTPAYPGQVGVSSTYELHRYDPAQKFRALDKGRLDVADTVYRLIYNDTVTSDGLSNVYDVPSAIDIGPISAIIEQPLAAEHSWNFLSNPQGDSTTGWTASSTTAATYARLESDRIIPKYDNTCTKLTTAASTAATYSQVVADMTNSITAALAADREMAFCAWVYCTEASKVALRIVDDSGTVATGSNHGGAGWELLTVEGTIAGNNATTLTARFVISSTANASTIYVNGMWFYFGKKERVADTIFKPEYAVEVRRDNATQHFMLKTIPPRGYQIRLIGKTVLSALGDTISTNVTNTMEVDNNTAEILYARAAEVLYQWERVNTDNVQEVMQRIQMVRERQPKLVQNFGQEVPTVRVRSAFSR